MSGTVWILGGEETVAQAIAAEAALPGEEGDAGGATIATRRAPEVSAVTAAAGDSVIDLGPAAGADPEDGALIATETERAARLAEALPAGTRVVRASLIGAAPDARALLQRAQAAAEGALAGGSVRPVALRVGLLLGPCGFAAGLKRALDRFPILPAPGIDRARLEPLALDDFARTSLAAAVAERDLEPAYDLGCGELVTGGLLLRLLKETLGHRRLVVPAPGFLRAASAPLFATADFPPRSVRRYLEALAGGLLPRSTQAYKDLDFQPRSLREGLALAAGMAIPLRKKGEGPYAAWKTPGKKGILWTKKN